MSLATIIKKIEEEAEAQGQEIIDQARIDDEQISKYARLKAEEEAAQIVHHAEEELQSFKSKQMATTSLHLRKEKLNNRQRILQDVVSKALEQVREYDADQRQAIMKTILLSVSEERQGSVLFSKTDQPLIDQKFIDDINAEFKEQNRKLTLTLSNTIANIERGCIVDFEDFEVNYSFENILSGLWTEIERDVSKQLFEGE